MAEPLKVGLAGLGTVGSSVIRLLDEGRDKLLARCGRDIEVVALNARSRAKFDEPCFVRIGHHAAERVLQIRHDHDRLDVGMRLQRERQRFDGNTGSRTGRNFERAQA